MTEQTRPGVALAFEACENFRELGGYIGAGGKRVRRGVFYRGPALANIHTPADRGRFLSLGIRTVFDFRSEAERAIAPDPEFPGVRNIAVNALFAADGSEQNFDLEEIVRSDEGLRLLTDGVHEGYVRMPFDNPAYRALFASVLAGDVPVLFHCTAGKDRTGVAAALLLLSLGVSRQDVVADYLLTNEYRARSGEAFRKTLEQMGVPPARAAEVAHVGAGVRRESIESALDAVGARYPRFEDYLSEQLGVDAAALEALRARYLE